MTVPTYLIGALSVMAFLALLALAAREARRRLMPDAVGAEDLLACLVLAVSLAVILPEALGCAGLLDRGSLLLTAAAVAAVARFAPGRRIPHVARPLSGSSREDAAPGLTDVERLLIGLALLVLAVAGAQWLAWSIEGLSHGPLGTDTLRYHLPLAARIARGADPFTLQFLDQDLLSTYDPLNAEMLHTDALALMGNDLLSPLVNLFWVGLAGLAGWVAGRPQRVGLPALVAVAAVCAVPLLVQGDGGGAENDIALVALLLTSVALLAADPERDGAIIVSGLAAGLALGSKYAAVGPVVILLVLLPWLLATRTPRRLAAWALPALLTGGFWYVRNWVDTGSPLPELPISLGPLSLPHVHDPVLALTGFSVSHYVLDGWFWRRVVLPGLPDALGSGWWLLLGLAVVGLGVALLRGPRLARALAVAALASMITYVFTPYGAGGPAGIPWLFVPDLRFLLPGISLSLLALALTCQRGERRWWIALLTVLGVTVAVEELLPGGTYSGWPTGGTAGAAVVVAVLGLAVAGAAQAAARRWRWQPVAALLLIGALAAGYAVQRRYVAHRYALMPLARWAQRVGGARIGEIGEPLVYGLYGPDAANRVIYLERPDGRGNLMPATSCAAWADELRRVDPRYLVIGLNTLSPRGVPQVAWTRRLAPVREILVAPDGTVVLQILRSIRGGGCAGSGSTPG